MRVATAFAIGSLAAAGCGGTDAAGSPEQARATIEAATGELLDGDGVAACGHLTEEAADLLVDSVPIQAKDCPDAVRKLHATLIARLGEGQIGELRAFEPDSVEVEGDRATAEFGEPPPTLADFPIGGSSIELVGEDGHWLISGVSL